jgi:hypothetical protein
MVAIVPDFDHARVLKLSSAIDTVIGEGMLEYALAAATIPLVINLEGERLIMRPIGE